ncbi:GtrA family protein [Geodermatophilus maliterrae]|uniref:GtrA family protein n=1 Tax=Geodermatophilus maliterrae TaxID=3162531 RepID=A0ABV3XCK9_9ACTN
MTGSLARFVLVGGTTVAIDAVVYQLLLLADVPHGWAKALGFVAGAVFAYVANWRFTFRGESHRWSLVAFVAVYLCALGLNVGVNALVLAVLDDGRTWQVAAAFLVATGVSAAWNFLGMARFVFRSPAGDPQHQEVARRHD